MNKKEFKDLLKRHTLFFEITGILLYEELIFKGIFGYPFDLGFLPYILGFAVVFYFSLRLLPQKAEKIVFFIILGFVSFLFSLQVSMYTMYNFYFDIGLLTAADQVGAFWKDILSLIFNNFDKLLLLWLPFILGLVFSRFLDFKPFQNRWASLSALAVIVFYVVAVTPENITTDLSVVKNGVIGTFFNDFREKEEIELVIEEPVMEETVEEVEETKELIVHEYDFDFESTESENADIQKLNDYFASQSGQVENEMTGVFEGKNLILILAESFNDIAVSEDLTPTLYKMIHEGFEFTRYYSTSYNSTLGGEFQLLNGMYAMSGSMDTWKAGTNYFPMGPGYLFTDAGYSVRAYHDHDYTYMNRNNYEKAVGFENYVGCNNGLEQKMACWNWFESDVDMANATIDDYINEDQFFTYYVTVSGHGPYGYGSENNRISWKYLEEIRAAGRTYSEKVECYLSTMIELDRMMEVLIDKLDEAGKLEDTVFVIVGDHYPYYLDVEEIKELCGETRESVVGVCENSLIIYNKGSEKVTCDKTGNTMDVIATIYNLFGIDYDSRLIPGKDLFSTAQGFALFGNGSWVSDSGIYYAHTGSFVPREGVEVSAEYFEKANAYATSQMSLTNKIILNDYYRYLWEYKK